MSKADEFIEEMNIVQSILLDATSYGLQTEVVTYALKSMKEDPTLSISMAMSIGYDEWIK